MAQIVTFDPATLRIVEVDTGADNAITWREIYSEWKDWLLADHPARGGYPQAFRVIGGEERGGGAADVGITHFLMGGWKFRPAEHSHNVTIEGNIVNDPAGERVWVPTLGSYTVAVQLESSNIVDTVADSAVTDADVTAIGAEVEDRLGEDVAAAGTMARLSGFVDGVSAVLTNAGSGVLQLVAGALRQTITTSGDMDDTGSTTTFERDDP